MYYQLGVNYLMIGGVIFLYMLLWYGVALLKKRNDVADVAWGLGFLLIALVTFFQGGLTFDMRLVVTILVSVWALRLSGHIYLRNRHKTEDVRYRTWREQWGKWFYIRTFLQVFLLQGVLMLFVSSPVIIINTMPLQPISWLVVFGIVLWCIGFFFEVVGDWQLSQFLNNPNNKGTVMQSGLWNYTRHPNYFGEVTQWWGIACIALVATSYGWIGFIGPITITYLIGFVSGIPMLENRMKQNPAFAQYMKEVSVFFPWRRRHE